MLQLGQKGSGTESHMSSGNPEPAGFLGLALLKQRAGIPAAVLPATARPRESSHCLCRNDDACYVIDVIKDVMFIWEGFPLGQICHFLGNYCIWLCFCDSPSKVESQSDE